MSLALAGGIHNFVTLSFFFSLKREAGRRRGGGKLWWEGGTSWLYLKMIYILISEGKRMQFCKGRKRTPRRVFHRYNIKYYKSHCMPRVRYSGSSSLASYALGSFIAPEASNQPFDGPVRCTPKICQQLGARGKYLAIEARNRFLYSLGLLTVGLFFPRSLIHDSSFLSHVYVRI